ncbi:hypothetical protein PV729_45560 [Streptomyces europaeiscabiei]|uniref:Uncharacterized protein n=1 Tax=Streptomyces europaeiscabiei TaxID=146819 RepID=A0ABU4NXC3_9ACTN|nr:hypothetical protein [Streptomyces europaeiscabiei]MDX2763372.1 hypothetical protein [Streptomyces europaeiscabiei]MDX3544371.1 hypothetical protein [Streptomyces europaeiscabiei]MDX3558844.1 hypothetical protein [Streptomyces europaeiscabiei]MDX3707220.1 hypothetical protein [Streptomyces europaeiscabiei]
MNYKIEGPTPLTLKATEDGAELGVVRFLHAVFLDLFNAADSDPKNFGKEFAEMHALAQSAQTQGRDSHARHEFDERMNKLLDEFADGGTIDLYAGGLHQLRDAATEITAPRPVPGQRSAGAA